MTRSVDRPGSQGTGAAPSALVRYPAELAVLLVMLTWGANVVMVKTAIRDVPPVLFAFVRFGTAFLVLLAVLRWREGSVWLPLRDVLPMLLLGIAGFALNQDLGPRLLD